ncbi:hypothetical protein EAE96_010559 [Botrytis aclada]|nr:hypothetical protein EAE96_010559 [Botrytis aclada]
MATYYTYYTHYTSSLVRPLQSAPKVFALDLVYGQFTTSFPATRPWSSLVLLVSCPGLLVWVVSEFINQSHQSVVQSQRQERGLAEIWVGPLEKMPIVSERDK